MSAARRAARRVGGAVVLATVAAGAEPTPWRAQQALGAPSWLRLGLEHRARVERLSPDFRAGARDGVTALSLRTLLSAEARSSALSAGVELADSRAFASRDDALNPTVVDPLDVLQVYAGVRGAGVLVDGDRASVKVGRFTIDLGSRRLVARNDFRNTINSFTGVDLQWTSPGGHTLRALAVSPVVRRPSTSAALADAELARDRENGGALLWAVHFGSAPLGARLRLESYVVGLHERDTTDVPSSNRRLVTPAVRVLLPPSVGAVDAQVEAMAQLGTSRASTGARDVRELRHRAAAVHASLGTLLDAPWRPRGAVLLDAATGDDDPADGTNGRFDPLFAARRFDFGPTGFYGALARSNLVSPGARLEVAPVPGVEGVVTYRAAWLASSRDAWTTSGLRDRAGASGSFVGHQVDARARWLALPGNVALEVGGAVLVRGRFTREAPGAPSGDPVYLYAQAVGTL